MRKVTISIYSFFFSLIMTPFLLTLAIVSRFYKKKVDIGLGPEPLINNVYHKNVLENIGYTSETYVTALYYITDKFDKFFINKFATNSFLYFLAAGLQINKIQATIFVLFRYKALYFYFNGGVISFLPGFIWLFEPLIYKIANIKVVVMPYGSDVQEMSRSRNLLYKHYLSKDYPAHRFKRKVIEKKIDLWIAQADFVISGVEWVDYMYYWDMLMLGHFSIDVNTIKADENLGDKEDNHTFIVLHAPNHTAIKGTEYLQKAIKRLKNEGFDIELKIIQKVSNSVVIEAIKKADLIADQFIIGWYAMFAIEAMALEKPVLCFLRDDLVKFYEEAGLINKDEIPLINCPIGEIYERIKYLCTNRHLLREVGFNSRQFVEKYHSYDAIGKYFAVVNEALKLSHH